MIFMWVGFLIIIFLLLSLDLGVFHRKNHEIKAKETILWTFFWIALALLFNIFVYYAYKGNWLGIRLEGHNITSGGDAALKFFTGYIIEKSLSIDNIFVISMIFNYFQVPAIYQHRVLFWGILGALVMRGIMIIAGAVLIEKFSWMIYIFGGFLIITAIKMFITSNENIDPEQNILYKTARMIYPVTKGFEGSKFFTKVNQVRSITPLFLVLLIIESSDVFFAIDSIPAIFAVTTDPFIIFTSNIFAILGLRSLYFALAVIIDKFQYLKISLVFVLAYVGIKMLLSQIFPIPTLVSLSIIGTAIFVGIFYSIVENKKKSEK